MFVSEGLSGPFDCCRKLKTANLLIMHMKSKHGVRVRGFLFRLPRPLHLYKR